MLTVFVLYALAAALCYKALTIKDRPLHVRKFSAAELCWLVPLWPFVVGVAYYEDVIKLWQWMKARRA